MFEFVAIDQGNDGEGETNATSYKIDNLDYDDKAPAKADIICNFLTTNCCQFDDDTKKQLSSAHGNDNNEGKFKQFLIASVEIVEDGQNQASNGKGDDKNI